jgi:hypothetical protein
MPKRISKSAARSRHAVSRNAERAPGQGSTTTQSSDWLAERDHVPPATADATHGVPIGTGAESIAARGNAVESRRGSHKSG